MNGIFGNMFDFNGDGDLNLLEQATEFAFLDMLIKQEDEYDELPDEDPNYFIIYTDD